MVGHERGGIAPYWISSVVFSADGERIVTAGYSDRSVRIWDVNSGTELQKLQDNSRIHFADISPDGRRIITASDRRVLVWNLDTGEQLPILLIRGDHYRIYTASNGGGEAKSVAFSPDGQKVVVSFDRTIVDIIHDEKEFAFLRRTRIAAVYDSESGEELHRLQGHTATINSAVFSHDGKRVITASDDGTARIWILE